MLRPSVVILDEPTAGLDVSVQATILRLFRDLAHDFRPTDLFISQELAAVRRLCPRVAVMYLGRVVEAGPAEAVFADPQDPYTCSLIDSIPLPRGRRVIDTAWLDDEPPEPRHLPESCRFHPRCPLAQAACRATLPALMPLSAEHAARLSVPARPRHTQRWTRRCLSRSR